jgi:hypothetical protein
LNDRAGKNDAGAAAYAEQGRHHPDRSGHPLTWELVADDPEREGKIPPAAPCTTRPMSNTANVVASAETTVAMQSRMSTTTSSRALPYMSPRRPITVSR